MKQIYKTICLAAAGMFALSANAQIFFTEDFEGTMDGTTNIPVGWTESGLSTDGIWSTGDAAAATSAYLTWPATTNGTMFAFTNDDACNCDKSADRMLLPAQDFSAITNPVVQLIADFYLNNTAGDIGTVEVSTDGGGTWTVVHTLAGGSVWIDDVVVDLSAYIGQNNVLISFLYNDAASWGYGMGVDEVRLNESSAFDDLTALYGTGEYTIIPLPQVVAMDVEGAIYNSGTNDITDAVLSSNVYMAPDFVNPVYTQTSTGATVLAGDTLIVNNGTYTPSAIGQYVMEHIVSTSLGSDVDNTNDTTYYSFTVTDTVYARDNGNGSFQLGIGAGAYGTIGQNFMLNVNDTISSVTFAAGGLVAGDTVNVQIYNTDVTGMPTTMIHAEMYICPGAGPIFEVPIPGGVDLTVGNYFVGIEEAISTANYGLLGSDTIFTPNTAWFNVNGGAFSTVESFNPTFGKAYIIRPNFANIDQCSSLLAAAAATDATCNGAMDGTATATATGGLAPYTYMWDAAAGNQTTATATGLAAGSYDVTVTDANGCTTTETVVVTEPTAVSATMSSTDETAAGNDGTATATAAGGTSPYTYSWDNGGTTSMISGLAAGTYVVTITDANGCTYMDSVVVNSAAVGINELTASSVSMYPNPVSDVLTITVENNQSLIAELYDINGKLISANSVNGTAVISVSNLDKGVYFIQFVAVDGSQIGAQQKLIIE